MTFFLSDRPLATGERVALTGEEARHALASRRVRPGERLAVQDPTGSRFSAVVDARERHELWLRVEGALPVPSPPVVRLTVLQAAVKAKAAEWIVQKLTELGVARLLVFPSAHCAVPEREWRGERAGERWRRIAWEACKQSDRATPPLLESADGLAEALAATQDAALGWVLAPERGRPSAEALATAVRLRPESARVLVGPEGGLSSEEVAQAEAAGCSVVRLGETILRAESAAAAAAALLLYGVPAAGDGP